MKHNKVGSVMTTDVVRAEYGTPFAVVDQLTWRLDDTGLRPDELALQSVADDWLRRL